MTVNSGEATLTQARTLDGLTTGVVTATIADTRVSDLVGSSPLLDANGNNAFTITIGTDDATVSAADLNTLNGLTTVAIDAENVSTITSTGLTDINTLYTSSGFSGLGNETIEITDELSVGEANTLDDLTTGSIVATIGNTRVSELLDESTPLQDANENNAYTISISTEDAAVSASDLNAINAITSIAVNLVNVNSITASDFTDLTTLNTNRNEFSNITGITAITVTDNGGSEESVDYGTLETIIDNYQTNFNSSAVFSLQSEDTIVIDTDSELSAFLNDVASGALVITNQSITIDSAAPITVSQASKIDSLTTGVITATIGSARVSDLLGSASLSDDNENNAYTISISEEDATGLTVTQLNAINALTSLPVESSCCYCHVRKLH